MKGEELYTLIQNLAGLSEKMCQIKIRPDFHLSNEYTISGYDVVKIKKVCESVGHLISITTFMPQ